MTIGAQYTDYNPNSGVGVNILWICHVLCFQSFVLISLPWIGCWESDQRRKKLIARISFSHDACYAKYYKMIDFISEFIYNKVEATNIKKIKESLQISIHSQ